MKNWTTQAEQRLTEYLQERARREGLDSEDAEELKEDLRSHIYEETEAARCEEVGLMQLENVLGKLDSGSPPPLPPEPQVPIKSHRGGFWDWTFGVIFPLGVLIFEVWTSACADVFINPAPTWWHVAWIAMVPFLNLWLILGNGDDRKRGLAAGFVLVTAGFYGLLFIPLIGFSILGLLFFGLGLVPLTPILATWVSWRIGSGARWQAEEPARFKSGWRWGVLASLLTLVALEGPTAWTRMNLSTAVAGGKNSEAAISRLRFFHSESSLLGACYGRSGRLGTGMNTEKARDVFFRVTGKPFNSFSPPPNARGKSLLGRNSNNMDEFEFDDHRGGDQVAVRLKKLDLAQSRFDGHVNAQSRIGYGEWTLVFRNDSMQDKEARCQVKLPREGRVSRLTLWVNGEPREAAFSTVSKVKAAYKSVVVVQRRDPVMVNMVGPDTVMLQCFPVPSHGEMKIRFGITAPLDGTRWELPHIVERNFGTATGLEHAVWVQGDSSFQLTGGKNSVSSAADGPGQSLSATLAQDALMNPGVIINTAKLPAAPPVVWCEDPFAKPGESILIREPVATLLPAAGKLVVVIDGSLSMEAARDHLLKAISGLPADRLQLILADDGAGRISVDELRAHHFTGGRDNEPALREGIRLARENHGPLVWIHGPLAVGLAQTEAISQLLERGSVRPTIYDIEAAAGPNRLAEAIYQTGCLRGGPPLADDGESGRFLEGLLTEHQETTWRWKHAATAESLTGTRVWDQLARFWAGRMAEDTSSGLSDAERSALAAGHQVVTPLSGAVVLETQQQYAENDLTPGDPSASPQIPNVPEPSTGLLILISTAAALMRRKRAA